MEKEEEIVILAVDDDPPILKAVRFVLEQEGYRVFTAERASEALALAGDQRRPDLVISDVNMPGMDGFCFCREVRNIPGNELIPFIFLTGEKSVDARVNGILSGANAYLVKPFDPKELAVLVRANLVRHRAYEKQAMHDSLTGIANRRSLTRILGIELSRAHRYHRPLTVAILDLDHFKQINDTQGHLVGDRILVGVAEVFCSQVRQEDTVGRFGGEEFLVILPETTSTQAMILLERLRGKVEESFWDIDDSGPIGVTVSIGMSEARDSDRIEDLLERSDKALYRAKKSGRNRLEVEE